MTTYDIKEEMERRLTKLSLNDNIQNTSFNNELEENCNNTTSNNISEFASPKSGVSEKHTKKGSQVYYCKDYLDYLMHTANSKDMISKKIENLDKISSFGITKKLLMLDTDNTSISQTLNKVNKEKIYNFIKKIQDNQELHGDSNINDNDKNHLKDIKKSLLSLKKFMISDLVSRENVIKQLFVYSTKLSNSSSNEIKDEENNNNDNTNNKISVDQDFIKLDVVHKNVNKEVERKNKRIENINNDNDAIINGTQENIYNNDMIIETNDNSNYEKRSKVESYSNYDGTNNCASDDYVSSQNNKGMPIDN